MLHAIEPRHFTRMPLFSLFYFLPLLFAILPCLPRRYAMRPATAAAADYTPSAIITPFTMLLCQLRATPRHCCHCRKGYWLRHSRRHYAMMLPLRFAAAAFAIALFFYARMLAIRRFICIRFIAERVQPLFRHSRRDSDLPPLASPLLFRRAYATPAALIIAITLAMLMIPHAAAARLLLRRDVAAMLIICYLPPR